MDLNLDITKIYTRKNIKIIRKTNIRGKLKS